MLSFSKLFDRLRPRADTTPFHDAFLDKDGDGGGRFFVLERSKDKLGRVGILLPKGAQRATPANGNNTQDSRQNWGAGDCFHLVIPIVAIRVPSGLLDQHFSFA